MPGLAASLPQIVDTLKNYRMTYAKLIAAGTAEISACQQFLEYQKENLETLILEIDDQEMTYDNLNEFCDCVNSIPKLSSLVASKKNNLGVLTILDFTKRNNATRLRMEGMRISEACVRLFAEKFSACVSLNTVSLTFESQHNVSVIADILKHIDVQNMTELTEFKILPFTAVNTRNVLSQLNSDLIETLDKFRSMTLAIKRDIKTVKISNDEFPYVDDAMIDLLCHDLRLMPVTKLEISHSELDGDALIKIADALNDKQMRELYLAVNNNVNEGALKVLNVLARSTATKKELTVGFHFQDEVDLNTTLNTISRAVGVSAKKLRFGLGYSFSLPGMV
jgi:hypothetical protein